MIQNIDPELLLNAALELEDEIEPCVGVESKAHLYRLHKTPIELAKEATLRTAFSVFIRQLRLVSRLTTSELSKRTKIKEEHILKIESDNSYRASPRTLVLLAEFYRIPTNVVLQMAGALRSLDEKIGERMVQFATMSKGFEELSVDEKKIIQDFVASLRDYNGRDRIRDKDGHREAS